MICEEFEHKLLLGEPLNDGDRRHLAECKSCREFQRLTSMVSGSGFAGPSPELDTCVLGLAREELGRVRRRRHWRCWRLVLSAAACAAVALGLWWSRAVSQDVSGTVLAAVSPAAAASEDMVDDEPSSVLASEEAELADIEEDLMLLSSGSLEWEEPLLAERDEPLKSMPVSELSGMNDELYDMELMVKDL